MKEDRRSDQSVRLAQAKRDENLALLAEGIDPKAAREEKHQKEQTAKSNTLMLVASEWFEVKKTKITEEFAKDVWRSLELHIFPKLGNQPIGQIDAPTVIKVLRPIADRGNLETVKRLCQRLNEIMTFAVNTRNTGVIRHNSLIGIIPFLESLQTSAQSLEQRLCIRPCSVVKFVHASVATPKISS